jgi:hypothetical protein
MAFFSVVPRFYMQIAVYSYFLKQFPNIPFGSQKLLTILLIDAIYTELLTESLNIDHK